MIPVVAVALIDPDGRILMHRRPADKVHGGLWEFPGGKVEPGETLDQAAVREIDEELAVVINMDSLQPLNFAARPGEPHVVLLYTCRDWRGEPACQEGGAIGWFHAAELAGLAMPPLDVPLAARLAEVLNKAN